MKVKMGLHPIGPKPKKGLSSDASCSKNPGDVTFRVVDIASGKELYRNTVYGTNNTGEFLGVVCAVRLALKLKQKIVYTDSQTALVWARKSYFKTPESESPRLRETKRSLSLALRYLQKNLDLDKLDIRKWNTKVWGEIPADFGRKKKSKKRR